MRKFYQGDQVIIISSGQPATVDGINTIDEKEKVGCRWMEGFKCKRAYFFENELFFIDSAGDCQAKSHKFNLGEFVKIVTTGQSAMVITYEIILGTDMVECNWWQGDIQESGFYFEDELSKVI